MSASSNGTGSDSSDSSDNEQDDSILREPEIPANGDLKKQYASMREFDVDFAAYLHENQTNQVQS